MKRLSPSEFEQALCNYRLVFPGRRIEKVERARLDTRPLVARYWEMTGSTDSYPPDQMDWVDSLLADLERSRHPLLAYRPGLVHRLAVAFPSLVRQHHLELVLRERYPLVVHGLELDLMGYDLVVVSASGQAYGLAVGWESERARWYARTKRYSRALPRIELVIGPRSGVRCGQFWLAGPDQVRLVDLAIQTCEYTRGHARMGQQDSVVRGEAPHPPRPGAGEPGGHTRAWG